MKKLNNLSDFKCPVCCSSLEIWFKRSEIGGKDFDMHCQNCWTSVCFGNFPSKLNEKEASKIVLEQINRFRKD